MNKNYTAGFLNINLEDKAITVGSQTAVTVPGVYEAIEGNYRRPVIVHGLKIGSSERPAQIVNFKVSSTDFVGTLSVEATATGCDIYTLKVDDDDGVWVTKSSIKSAT